MGSEGGRGRGGGGGGGKDGGGCCFGKDLYANKYSFGFSGGTSGNEGVLPGGRGREEGVRGDVIDRCGSPEGIVKGCEAVCGVSEADGC